MQLPTIQYVAEQSKISENDDPNKKSLCASISDVLNSCQLDESNGARRRPWSLVIYVSDGSISLYVIVIARFVFVACVYARLPPLPLLCLSWF